MCPGQRYAGIESSWRRAPSCAQARFALPPRTVGTRLISDERKEAAAGLGSVTNLHVRFCRRIEKSLEVLGERGGQDVGPRSVLRVGQHLCSYSHRQPQRVSRTICSDWGSGHAPEGELWSVPKGAWSNCLLLLQRTRGACPSLMVMMVSQLNSARC